MKSEYQLPHLALSLIRMDTNEIHKTIETSSFSQVNELDTFITQQIQTLTRLQQLTTASLERHIYQNLKTLSL